MMLEYDAGLDTISPLDATAAAMRMHNVCCLLLIALFSSCFLVNVYVFSVG